MGTGPGEGIGAMKRKAVWVAIMLAAGAGAWGVYAWTSRETRGDVAFEVVIVSRGDIESTILTTGVVEPQNRVEIKPPISGRVEDILVREGDIVQKGRILAWMSSSERAALLDAARIKGPQEVTRWSQLYKPAPLVAPIEGVIIARAVEPGQSVTTADAILVLSDRLIVSAQVDETDIGAVAVGQTAAVSLDAYPSHRILAVVDHIAYEAKTVNNVTIYDVDVLPGDIPPFMRSGMTANVTLKTAAKQDVILVPAEAIQQRDGRSVVLTPAANRARPGRQEVRTGISDGKRTEIVSGLNAGDEVWVARARMPERRDKNGASNPFSPFGGRTRSAGGGR